MPSTLGIVASAIFTPLDLSPALWLDASDATTITSSGSPAAVSQWNNKGTLGNFTQGTGAVQPTTGVTTLNGLNVLDFAADYLTAANTNEWKFLHDGTIWIMAAVWKAGTTADPNALYGLFGSAVGSPDVGSVLAFDDRASNSRNNAVFVQTNRGVSGQVAVTSTTGNAYHSANQFVTLSARFDPSNATAANRLTVQVGTASTVANNAVTNAPSSANPTYPLQIGAASNNQFPLTGSIAELVIVSGTQATPANREALRDYLIAKWGL